jgi:hypothetical protein
MGLLRLDETSGACRSRRRQTMGAGRRTSRAAEADDGAKAE